MNLRLPALGAVAACAVVLPLATASAGPVGDEGHTAAVRASRAAVRTAPHDDPKAPAAGPAGPSALLGPGTATAARCGPELTSPDGVEAQTCVLTRGAETWARTYYRNATGAPLDAVLSLMGPRGRTVQMRCAVSADDEPASCETPREAIGSGARWGTGSVSAGSRGAGSGNAASRGSGSEAEWPSGGTDAYSAVAEFAGTAADAPLLLRAGSNSVADANSDANTGS